MREKVRPLKSLTNFLNYFLKGKETSLFLYPNIYNSIIKYIIMKDVYKVKVSDTISALDYRVKIVQEMVTGQRPADTAVAEKYLQEIKKGLESLQEIVDIS